MSSINSYLSYVFKDELILKTALTHPSIQSPNNQHLTYEKLEFLGDTVLSLIITNFLISEYKHEKEGFLAKRRAYLVSGKILVKVAQEINLSEFIEVSPGEEASGGRFNKSNLENCLESLIGALYLDGGLEICKNFIYRYWLPISRSIPHPPNDPKTALQEWAQKLGKSIPVYNVIKTEGSAHQPEFTISVTIDNEETAHAIGPSKKIAQQEAAQILLDKIRKNEN